jgi:hypothetical protein
MSDEHERSSLLLFLDLLAQEHRPDRRLRRVYFGPNLEYVTGWDSGFKWEIESGDTLPGRRCSHVRDAYYDEQVLPDALRLSVALRPHAAALRQHGILLMDSHGLTAEGEHVRSQLWSE